MKIVKVLLMGIALLAGVTAWVACENHHFERYQFDDEPNHHRCLQ